MELNEKYMQRALTLARMGVNFAHPNPVVGAVIVAPDGKVIGEGFHRCCGEAHAEVNAINSVADKELLKDSTMYVTLEPCSHFGRTAPCADLIIRMGIPRVVVGVADPFEKVAGKGIQKLRDAGVEVEVGLMEKECSQINAMFLTAHREHRPYVCLKWAQSADGYMDVKRIEGEEHPMISTELTQMLVHRVRSHFDAILVGSGTVLADDPTLSNRLWPGKSPRPVVLDRRGRVGEQHQVMQRDPIIVRDDKPLREIMHDLYEKHGITSLMVEGGAQVLQAFIDAGLWDLARVETSPVAFGEFGIVTAPDVRGWMPTKTIVIDGHNVNYYSQNPLIEAKNI